MDLTMKWTSSLISSSVPIVVLLHFVLPAAVHSLSSNCFYLPNMALNGGTYDELPATEIKFCCMACAHDPCCIAYTFDKQKNRCYMKSAISDSYKTSNMVSGIKANTHSGQGALLKNIRIYGGTASAVVNLPNSEDCMQYCTAYGIFSWTPLPPAPTTTTTTTTPPRSGGGGNAVLDDESSNISGEGETPAPPPPNGECSCMSRISSIEYSFGSRSAIFPSVSSL